MSIFEYQQINQQIKDKLFELAYKVECFNKTGDFDINRYSESYFKNIMNVIYKQDGWNFEKAPNINQDTFDIFDFKNKVCIQITSNTRNSKISSTLESFNNQNHSQTFDELIIFFLSIKKPNRRNDNPDYKIKLMNMIDFVKLIESKCSQSEILEIRDILYQDYHLHYNQSNKNFQNCVNSITEEEFLRRINLEKELKECLLFSNYIEQYGLDEIIKNPYKKIYNSRFILRSINDETYPVVEEYSDWYRTFMYDFYEKGLLIWIDAMYSTKAIININDEWRILSIDEYEDAIPEDFTKVNVRTIAKLPFKYIVHFKDGDEYYQEYHLYCKFNGINNTPYEEIYYLQENYFGCYSIELDNDKEIKN